MVINSGEIHGKRRVGGIAGANYGSIINCGNKAKISGIERGVGGVCGLCHSGLISGCFNYGEIVSSDEVREGSYAGGIVGVVGHGSTVCDCYNKGKVVGFDVSTGGLIGAVGYIDVERTSVERCFSVGLVSSGNKFR